MKKTYTFSPYNKYLTSLNFSPKKQYESARLGETYRNGRLKLTLTNQKDEINDIIFKIYVNLNLIKEYESLVQILLNIMSANVDKDKHVDIGTPIEKCLSKINETQNEIIDLKRKVIIEKKRHLDKFINQNELNTQLKLINSDIDDEIDILRLKEENEQLMITINAISEELDNLSQKNNKIEKFLDNSIEYELIKELNELKIENKHLKNIIKNENNKVSESNETDFKTDTIKN